MENKDFERSNGKPMTPMENTRSRTYDVEFSSGKTKAWWQRTSERTLLSLLLLITTICIVLIVLITTGLHRKQENSTNLKDADICMTPVCIKTAATMLNSMDQTVDPCEDFFEYACSSWNKRHPIPDDKPSYSTFSKMRDDVQSELRVLLERQYTKTTPTSFHKTQSFYKACINESYIEQRDREPVIKLLDSIGGWPVLNSTWNETEFDYMQLMAKLSHYNNRILIEIYISADDRNSDVNIVSIDQPSLGMGSREYFLREKSRKYFEAYRRLATQTAIMLGAREDVAKRDMTDVVEFEAKIANLTVPSELRRDNEAIYKKMNIAQLYSNITNKIQWLPLLNLIFKNAKIQLNKSEEVVVYSPVYLQQLAELLEQTPNRTIANYMVWRFAKNRIRNLGKKYRQLLTDYAKVLDGTSRNNVRWRTCLAVVQNNMGMAIGRMFVEEHFDEESKMTALEMIKNLRSSFSELIDLNEWMDDGVKHTAKEKLVAIEEKIGYPEYILNDTALDNDYDDLNFDSHLYFENILENLKFIARKSNSKLRKPVKKTEWSAYPAQVNAFYSSTKNQIVFPAAMLQPPFYNKDTPKYLNYGGIGMVIGHEMTHGFDDRGRQYNKDGNLKQWWPSYTIDAFKSKAKCIISQYGNYSLYNMKLNGIKTQGENIADNGGLRQAYRAYQKVVATKPEPRMPGMSLNQNQLFFLNFAQVYCGVLRSEFGHLLVKEEHTPSYFRVIGTLSNSEDFAQAYKCALGTRMNPVKKCHVW